jgi:hypothetical protein
MDDPSHGDPMSDNDPRCPVCASDDVAIRGSTGPVSSPLTAWECRASLFAYRPGQQP